MNQLTIPGPSGLLEIALHENYADAPYLLVCHPHPLYGGTMNNKVVTMTAKAYEDMGCNVVRFNYRGVGASEGEYGDNQGEVDDANTVIKWLLANKAVTQLYFAGFSFGAYIAAQAAVDTQGLNQVEVKHLLLIAPSVVNSPFEKVTPLSVDTSIIMGDADEIVSFEAVQNWADHLYPPVELVVMEGASHFFHGRLTELKQQIKDLF